MLSFIVLVRNTRAFAEGCLQSLAASVNALGLVGHVEYLLVDDCSEEASDIPKLFAAFRASVKDPVRILRFKVQQHYVRGLAYTMSMARGESVFFFSHDMIVTPHAIATLLEVAAMYPGAGTIRPASGHMDGSAFAVNMPMPLRGMKDAWSFAKLMKRYHGTAAKLEGMMIGDAMIIRRDVIERVGVFDPRYFGLMGDIDYGLRLQHAGYECLTAPGAWVYHHGEGHLRDRELSGRTTPPDISVKVLHEAYSLFREKWDPSMADIGNSFNGENLLTLRANGPKNGQIYQPQAAPPEDVVEIS